MNGGSSSSFSPPRRAGQQRGRCVRKNGMRGILMVLVAVLLICTPQTEAARAQHDYTTATNFLCDNGSRSLPTTSVNDDFCDCVDGSDEPGTAACSGIQPTAPTQSTPSDSTDKTKEEEDARTDSPGFVCRGGVRATTLPASRVHDGICDCCDGSDEAPFACPDSCAEMHKEVLGALAAERTALVAGLKLKKSIVEAGTKLRAEWVESYVQAESSARALEVALGVSHKGVRAPTKEAGDADVGSDIAKRWGAKTDTGFADAEKELERKVQDRLVSMPPPRTPIPTLEEDGTIVVAAADGMSSPQRLPKPAVKPAVVKPDDWDEATMGVWQQPATTEEEGEEDKAYAGHLATINNAKKQVAEFRKASKEPLEKLKSFYALGDDVIGLHGTQLDLKSGEYTYQVDMLVSVTQIGGTHGTSRLGSFKRIVSEGSTMRMIFEAGDSCPGGVRRSANVILLCAAETALHEVHETERCMYRYEASSPVACSSARLESIELTLAESVGWEQKTSSGSPDTSPSSSSAGSSCAEL